VTLSTDFDALAEKATQGEMAADQDMPYGHRPGVWSDARNIGLGGWIGKLIAHVGNMEDPREAQDEWEANAAFIAWCFNHRAAISAALRESEAKTKPVMVEGAIYRDSKSPHLWRCAGIDRDFGEATWIMERLADGHRFYPAFDSPHLERFTPATPPKGVSDDAEA